VATTCHRADDYQEDQEEAEEITVLVLMLRATVFRCSSVQGWGVALLLLYGVQCAVGFWVNRMPAESRTRTHNRLLAGLGVLVVLLAFYDAWLGFVAVPDGPPLFWCMILFVVSEGLFFVPPLAASFLVLRNANVT
jgi:heme A synthase